MSANAETQLRIVQLALAAAFGRGNETRDPVELTGEVLAELFMLRAKAATIDDLSNTLTNRTDALRGLSKAALAVLKTPMHSCRENPKCRACDAREALQATADAIAARLED